MSYIRRASSSFTVHNGSVHRHRLLCAFRVNVSWRSTRRTLLPASTRGCQTWCPSRGEWNLSVHRASAVLLRGQIFEKIKLMSNVCKRSVRYKCKWKQVGDSGCVLQADPDRPVLAAGDPERTNMKKCDEMGGIPYHINVVKYMVRAVKRYEIQVVQLKCQSKNWFIVDYFSTQAWECRQPFYLSLSTAVNLHFSPSINSYFMVNFSQFEWTWPHFFFCFFLHFVFAEWMCGKSWRQSPAAMWQSHLQLEGQYEVVSVGNSETFAHTEVQNSTDWDCNSFLHSVYLLPDSRILFILTTTVRQTAYF